MKKKSFFLFLLIILFSCGEDGLRNNEMTGLDSNNSQFESESSDSDTYVKPSKELLLGKFNPAEQKGFSEVPSEMCSKPTFVQTKVLSEFVRMRKAAAIEGLNLFIVSGTRTFNDQKAIWERKWGTLVSMNKDSSAIALEILKYSSMPGTSRHHWGTDIDLVSVEPGYFESEVGDKMYKWLVLHAQEYGFCQVYSNKEETGRTGYSMEKWHWSFMPIAKSYLRAYRQLIDISDIKGFSGEKLVSKLDVIEKYVAGLDSICAYR